MADLTIGAFFFAMRSCEYSSVAERGKTKLLTVGNIRFYTKDQTEIAHLDPTLQLIAEYVTVTFEDQKNNHKMETRTQQCTGDQILRPVIAWSNVIARILASSQTSLATTVNFFHDTSARPGSEARLITQANTRSLLRTTATILGKKRLATLQPTSVRTHSNLAWPMHLSTRL